MYIPFLSSSLGYVQWLIIRFISPMIFPCIIQYGYHSHLFGNLWWPQISHGSTLFLTTMGNDGDHGCEHWFHMVTTNFPWVEQMLFNYSEPWEICGNIPTNDFSYQTGSSVGQRMTGRPRLMRKTSTGLLCAVPGRQLWRKNGDISGTFPRPTIWGFPKMRETHGK